MYTAKLSAVHASNSAAGITGAMLREACESTRPSTSPADRARFLAIYANFRDSSDVGSGGERKAGQPAGLGDGAMQALLGKLGEFGYDAKAKRLATA
jgi:hypothetical protein